jgi:small-conductance mechanosensitive channel
LVLARRRPIVVTRPPFALEAASTSARQQIAQVVAASRAPWGPGTSLSPVQSSELERSLQRLEAQLAGRERALADMELRLAERERELAESEALLQAREQLLEAGRRAVAGRPVLSLDEQAALGRLKEEMELQAAALTEDRAALVAREAGLLERESALADRLAAASTHLA